MWPAPLFTWDPTGTLWVEQMLQLFHDYQVEASVDLIQWILLSSIRSDSQGKLIFTDITASQTPFRFYRTLPK